MGFCSRATPEYVNYQPRAREQETEQQVEIGLGSKLLRIYHREG